MKPKPPVPAAPLKFDLGKLPFIGLPDVEIASPSQDHLPIADIVEDLILYKEGGAALVLEASSLNFGLLSEREQEAVITAYAGLINSLSFSIQIVVRSQKKDISIYLVYLNKALEKISNPRLRYLMVGYINFITETIKKKVVLSKKFYIVLPFSPLELGVAKSFLTITKRKKALPFPKNYIISKAKIILNPRKDHLIRQVGRLGLKLRQLSTTELIELLVNVYNPNIPVSEEGENNGANR